MTTLTAVHRQGLLPDSQMSAYPAKPTYGVARNAPPG